MYKYQNIVCKFSNSIEYHISKCGLNENIYKVVLKNLKKFFGSFNVLVAISECSLLICGVVCHCGTKIFLNITFTVHEYGGCIRVSVVDKSSTCKPKKCAIIDPEVFGKIFTFRTKKEHEGRKRHDREHCCVEYLCDYFGKGVLISRKNKRTYVHVPKKYIKLGYLEDCRLKCKQKHNYYVYKFKKLLNYLDGNSDYRDLEYLDYNNHECIIYIETGSSYEDCQYVIKSQKHPKYLNISDHLKQNLSHHSKNKYKCKYN